MADFTSSITGDWNDGATWGNASPGVKGTDWPGLAGDTATIASGDVVTYNVEETNVLGAVTIDAGGTLKFSRSVDTLLTIGDVDLTVNGIFDMGKVSDPIPDGVTAIVDHQSTNYNSELVSGSAAEVYICGDPDYFGSKHTALLQSDYTVGQTFTIVGDYTSDWNSGDTLILIRDGEYDSQNTDTNIVTIDTIAANGANTDITINEAFPGGAYSEDAMLFHVSRNVRYIINGSLNGPSPNTYDTTSGEFDLDVGTIELSACELGWAYNVKIYDATIDYVVMYNIYQILYAYRDVITNTIIYAQSAARHLWQCRGYDLSIIGCDLDHYMGHNTFYDFRLINHYSSGGFFNPNSAENFISGEFYKCGTTTNAPINTTPAGERNILTGHFGENAQGLSYWTNDTILAFRAIQYHGYIATIKDFHSPATTLADVVTMATNTYRNHASYWPSHFYIEALNGDRTNPIMVGRFGAGSLVDADGTGDEPSQRSGGNDVVWKLYTESNCDDFSRFLFVPAKVKYHITGSDTLSFKMYFQTNYVGNINYLIRAVHNGGVEYATGTISPRANQADWSEYAEISATFPNDGYIELDCIIWGYESGKYIWVDPIVGIS